MLEITSVKEFAEKYNFKVCSNPYPRYVKSINNKSFVSISFNSNLDVKITFEIYDVFNYPNGIVVSRTITSNMLNDLIESRYLETHIKQSVIEMINEAYNLMLFKRNETN